MQTAPVAQFNPIRDRCWRRHITTNVISSLPLGVITEQTRGLQGYCSKTPASRQHQQSETPPANAPGCHQSGGEFLASHFSSYFSQQPSGSLGENDSPANGSWLPARAAAAGEGRRGHAKSNFPKIETDAAGHAATGASHYSFTCAASSRAARSNIWTVSGKNKRRKRRKSVTAERMFKTLNCSWCC